MVAREMATCRCCYRSLKILIGYTCRSLRRERLGQGFNSPRLQSSLAAVAGREDCRAVALAEADPVSEWTLWRRATTRHATENRAFSAISMSRFVYVYVLQSEIDPERFYSGCSRDLRERFLRHNAGKVSHTAKFGPWRLKTYVAFSDET